MDLLNLSIKETHNCLIKKEFSVQELTAEYLKRIEERNPEVNAYLSVFSDKSLDSAKKIDQKISKKEKLSELAGIPCGIKDNILIEGEICTAGSKILENYKAPYTATAVKKLLEKDCIVLGKTNMDEFAMGSSGEYSAYGNTKNPCNLEYVPGGSSSGSAAAVAVKMCSFSLGSDTAGSVRSPASFCGVVGFKPTYGAVSRYGLIAMGSSLDQIGPIAKNVSDAEIVFNAIKGKDSLDSTSHELEDSEDLKNFKIGFIKESLSKGIDKEVKDVFNRVIGKLHEKGIEISEISLPHLEYGVASYYIVMPSEVSSNLARYDGIKYGKCQENEDLLELYLSTRKEYLGKEVKRRIMLGTHSLSSGYYDAYYLRAQKVKRKILDDFKKAFEKFDLLILPTSSILPFKFGQKTEDPLSMYMADLLTVPANLAGLPAISIPGGEVNGLSAGIQFIAPPFKEKRLFSFGKIFEEICLI